MLVYNPACISLSGWASARAYLTERGSAGRDQSGTGAWSNLHDIAHPFSCSAAADTAPMLFSALSTCSRATATTCDSGCSRSASEVLANLLRRQRDRISFNEIGFRVEVAAVKWRTTNSQIIRRIKTI